MKRRRHYQFDWSDIERHMYESIGLGDSQYVVVEHEDGTSSIDIESTWGLGHHHESTFDMKKGADGVYRLKVIRHERVPDYDLRTIYIFDEVGPVPKGLYERGPRKAYRYDPRTDSRSVRPPSDEEQRVRRAYEKIPYWSDGRDHRFGVVKSIS